MLCKRTKGQAKRQCLSCSDLEKAEGVRMSGEQESRKKSLSRSCLFSVAIGG